MTRPRIILLIGLPGCGKSTYARRQRFPVLSSDELRQLLMDDATDQTINRRVFALLRRLLRLRLELKRPVTCIDATNLTVRERRPYVILGQMYDADVEAIFFDISAKVCKRRNRGRRRVVPEDVLDQMAGRLRPPTIEEGFQRITVVDATNAVRTTTQVPEPA